MSGTNQAQIGVGTTGPIPRNKAIGTNGQTLVWTFQGKGSVTNVQIASPGSYFQNFRANGNAYQVDYNGSTGTITWNYTVTATWNPSGDFGGELNNGG